MTGDEARAKRIRDARTVIAALHDALDANPDLRVGQLLVNAMGPEADMGTLFNIEGDALAGRYGVSVGMVGHICTGRSWKHVSGPRTSRDRWGNNKEIK
jgi:hypothetical protein